MRCFVSPKPAPPSEAALKLLNTRFSGRCMLPRLRDIRWFSASLNYLELILPLIVSPILTTFELLVDAPRPLNALHVVSALKALAPAYNSLVEVYIPQFTIHDPRIIDAASALLLKCNPDKLHRFLVGSALSTEAFIYATRLPNLEQFIIRTDTTEPGIPLLTLTFPSLKSLKINTTYPHSPLLQTIAHIQSTTFTNLDLEFPAAAMGTFLLTTLTALRPRNLHQTLTRLSITSGGGFDFDGVIIQPLLFLNQLTTLEINLLCSQDRCPYKLSDKDLEALVKAMPKLISLCLGQIPCSRPANNTMKSLVSIVKHCKHLEELIIHTNVEAIVAGAFQRHYWEGNSLEDPLSTFVGCPLSRIMFGPCPMPREQQGAVIFALTLLRLFPRLATVTALHPNAEADPQFELVNGVIATHRCICANIVAAGKLSNSLSYARLLMYCSHRYGGQLILCPAV